MKTRLRILTAWILLAALTACTLPVRQTAPGAVQPGPLTPIGEGPPDPIPTSNAQPVSEGNQQVANALGAASQEPTMASSPNRPLKSAPDEPCNQAAPGRPFDLTIPDGKIVQPGESFSKTWRLVNAGACAWDPGYAVIFFSGEQMSAPGSQYLHESVEPGGSIDVTVDMVAPLKPGTYQSNWMLSDEDTNLFGIGPSGRSAFWARIQVTEELITPTPGALPTPTVTPVVFYGGELTLYLQDWMDFDSGMINTGSTDDLTFQMEGEQAVLRPSVGTRIAVFGARTPTENDCRSVRLSADPLALDSLKEGVFLCYRSNQGLPGYARLPVINLKDNFLKLEFLTWSAP